MKPMLLASIRMTGFNGQKLDREASREYTDSKGATEDSAAIVKSIVSKAFIDPVKSIEGEIRRTFYRYALETGITGCRMIAVNSRDTIESSIGDLFVQREQAIDDMVSAYDSERARRKIDMGDLFVESDYPIPSQVRARFSGRLIYMPLPTPEAAGVDDPEIKKAIECARKLAFETAHADAWKRIADAASDTVTRLSAYVPGDKPKGIFRESLVESLKVLVSTLDDMNVWDDADLSACLAVLKRDIADVAIETLKSDDQKRFAAIAAAESVLNAALSPKIMPDEPARQPIGSRVAFHTTEKIPDARPDKPPAPVVEIPSSHDFELDDLLN